MSLLQAMGFERELYRQRFGSDVLDDFRSSAGWNRVVLAVVTANRIRLTVDGLAWTDAIGPWLYSPRVQQLTEAYQWQ